ncbi:MAG: DNA-formamidopyrimidine glycosylase family protein [Planctomycetota bacterium]
MPELPEVDAYVEGLRSHVVGQRLEAIRLASPFLLRTVEPAPNAAEDQPLAGAERLGKRIVLEFPNELFFVIHPMIAGRLRWKKKGAALPGKAGLLALDFEGGSLVFTEQGSKRRASLHVVQGRGTLQHHDPGGADPLTMDQIRFGDTLRTSGHTVKRALCTPQLFSGIGNAWSDEILFEARMSPMLRSATLDAGQIEALHGATQRVLSEARERLIERARGSFPDKVTAFQPEMKVHGRYRDPCERCKAPIQRITRASGHDFHYCARCQTGGKVLSDRSLSRLLKDDWPRRIEELMD